MLRAVYPVEGNSPTFPTQAGLSFDWAITGQSLTSFLIWFIGYELRRVNLHLPRPESALEGWHRRRVHPLR